MSAGPIEIAYVEIKPKIDPNFERDVLSEVNKALAKVGVSASKSFTGVSAASKKATTAVSSDFNVMGRLVSSSLTSLDTVAARSFDEIVRAAGVAGTETSTAFEAVGGTVDASLASVAVAAGTTFDAVASAATTSAADAAAAFDGVGVEIDAALAVAGVGADVAFGDISASADLAAADAGSAFDSVGAEIDAALSDASASADTVFSDISTSADNAASDAGSAFDGVGTEIDAALAEAAVGADVAFGDISTIADASAVDVGAAFDGVGAEIGTSVAAGAKEAETALAGVGAAAKVAGEESAAAGAEAGGLGGSLKKAFIGLGILEAAHELIDFGKAAETAQAAERITERVLKNTGDAAHLTAAQFDDLIKAQSAKTGADLETVRGADNILLTFKAVRNEVGAGNDIFSRASGAAADLAAVMGGSLEGATRKLGRALSDPTKASGLLARAGVVLTAQQKDQIKTLVASGHSLEAQKLILDQLAGSVGGAAAAAATPTQKLHAIFEQLKISVGTGLLPVFNALAVLFANPAFQRFAVTAGKVIADAVVKLVAAGKELARVFGPTLAAVFHLIGDAFAYIAAHPVVVDVLKAVALALAGLLVAEKVAGLVVSLGKAVAGLAGFLASPVGLVLALAAALVYAYQHSKTFRDFVDQLVVSLKKDLAPVLANVSRIFTTEVVPAVQKLVQAFVAYALPALKQFGQFLVTNVLPVLKTLVEYFIKHILPAVISVAQVFIKNLVPVIKSLAGTFIKDILPALKQLYDKFSKDVLPVLLRVVGVVVKVDEFLAKLAFTILGKVLPPLIRFIGPVLGGLIHVISDVIGWVADLIKGILNLPALFGKIGAAIGGFFAAIPGALAGAASAVLGFFASLPGIIGNALLAVGGALVSFVASIPGYMLQIIAFFVQLPVRISEIFVSLVGTVVGLVAQLFVDLGKLILAGILGVVHFFEELPGRLVGAFKSFVGAVAGAVASVVSFLAGLPGRAVSALSKLGSALLGVVTAAGKAMVNGVSTAISDVVRFVTQLPSKIAALGSAMFNAGKSIIGKLFNGLKSLVGGAGDLGKAIINGIIDGLNAILPHSFSAGFSVLGHHVGIHFPLFPNIPHLADGGVFDRATNAIIGEAGKEVAIPLTRPKRAMELVRESGLLNVMLKGGLTQAEAALLQVGRPNVNNTTVNKLEPIAAALSRPPGVAPAAADHLALVNLLVGALKSSGLGSTTPGVAATFNLLPGGDPETHARQIAVRLAAQMER